MPEFRDAIVKFLSQVYGFDQRFRARLLLPSKLYGTK